MPSRALAVTIVCGSCLLCATARAEAVIEGTVFVDRDGDGKRSPDEPGLEGVRVVWETSVWTTTDAAGRYRLSAPQEGIVWARAPDGYEPGPVWRETPRAGSLTVDLGLRPSRAEPPLLFVHATDPHLGNVGAGDVARALAQATALERPPHFLVLTGDLVSTTQDSEYAALRQALATITVPFVPVPGNHDWHDGGLRYRKLFGPPFWSFDAGGVHFIVLNFNVSQAEQLDFAAADLADIPRDRRVVAFTHFLPNEDLAAGLARAGVTLVYSGHLHANGITRYGTLTDITTETLAMGGIDYTPAGYRVVRMVDGQLRSTHHTVVAEPVLRLVHPLPAFCAPPGAVRVLVSAELGAADAMVTVSVDGGPAIRLVRSGGWIHSGTVDVPRAGKHVLSLAARAAGRVVERREEICVAERPRAAPRPGAWTQAQGSAAHQGSSPIAIRPPLRLLWSTPVGGHLRGGSPAVAQGKVYVPVLALGDAEEGGIVALDAATGARAFEIHPGVSVHGTPAIEGGLLVFMAADGTVRAHDARTGAARWRVDLTEGLGKKETWAYASPTIAANTVYAAVNGRLVALDLATGKVKWRIDPGGDSTGTFAAPTIGDGVGAVPVGRHTVTAFRLPQGRLVWRLDSTATQVLHASPLLDGDAIYLLNVRGHVRKTELATADTIWKTGLYGPDKPAIFWEEGVVATPALANGRLFVATPRGLFAVAARDGDVLWTAAGGPANLSPFPYGVGGSGFVATPVVTGDVLWSGGVDGMLRAHFAPLGMELDAIDLGAPILSGLAAAGPYLVVSSWDGVVRAFVAGTDKDMVAGRHRPMGVPGPIDLLVLGAVLVAAGFFAGRRRG